MTQAVPRAAADGRPHVRRAGRAASATVCPTTARNTTVLPGPRELAPGADRVELKLKATAPNGDKVTQVLTFHRGSYLIDVAFDVTNATAAPDLALRVLPADARRQAGGRAELDGAGVLRRPGRLQRQGQFQEGRIRRDRQARADPARKSPYQKTADNGWVGMIEHYFVTAWLPSDEKKTPREFYTKKLDDGLYAAGVIVPVGTIAPGATGEVRVPLYVGPQDQDVLAQDREGPRPRRRLRHLHGARRAAVLAAQVAARPPRQLGLGDRRDDHHDQGARSIR